MTQLGSRQWAQMWTALSTALASAVPAEVRAEGHLATEAVVAYVDGELSITADARATRHLAGCTLCTTEVAAQRQARAAVRGATPPAMPASLLAALHAIPHSVELPPGPEGLAVGEDGELVVAQRPHPSLNLAAPLGLSAPLGSGERLGSTGLDGSSGGSGVSGRTARRALGAGVVVSGLMLSALALSSLSEPAAPASPRPGAGTGSVPASAVPARFDLDRRSGTGHPADRPSTDGRVETRLTASPTMAGQPKR
jgi:anti-sigma factor RsiW